MKIGFDLDNVVVDFFPSFLDFYNQKYGTPFRTEDFISYYIWEVGIGSSKEEAISFIDEFYDSDSYDMIPFVDGAREGLEELSKENELYFPTSRFLRYKPKTIIFFQNNLPEHLQRLFFTEDFSEKNGKTKADICSEFGFDFYVEDCFEYAESCARRGTKVLLLRKPWNERYWVSLKDKGSLLVPVKNWQEIVKRIKEGENV